MADFEPVLWNEELDRLQQAAQALLDHLWTEHPHSSGELMRLSRILGDHVAATRTKGIARYYARAKVRGSEIIAYAFSESEATTRLDQLVKRALETQA